MKKINPITRLDYPDPDVIRVGNTYYMVSTTMYFMPGCEILRSYDLVHWEHASYVFERLDSTERQTLSGKENAYGNGMWAASLRYHGGIFYVCFVANDTHKTYLYTSKSIEGPWEKSEISGFYHDNSILFDDDGKIYIVYGNREIHITELDLEKKAPKDGGLDKVIIKDRDDAPLGYEGAHFYKINGKYYIFFIHIPASSGKRTESCFVSDKPEGPYYGRDICDDDRNYRGMGVAQGGIVESPKGNWYGIFFQDSGAVGRIPVLVPITWTNLEKENLGPDLLDSNYPFPVVGNNGKIPECFEIDKLNLSYCYAPLVGSDDFSCKAVPHSSDHKRDSFGLKSFWQFNHEPELSLISKCHDDDKKCYIKITTDKLCNNLVQAKNTLTQRCKFPGCRATVSINGENMKNGDYAGLCILESCYGFIALTKRNDEFFLVMCSREITEGGFWGERHDDSAPEELASIKLDSPVAKLTATVCFDEATAGESFTKFTDGDDTARFSCIPEGKLAPIKLGPVKKLSFKLDHFTGARFGLFMYSTKETGGSAYFSDFIYET
ncbi:MAG: family 43 glycosylhydrolase [Butyrivibrio sp.]|nr:family 43 glycosylhydrolase [Butyrivibrio sp.]